MNMSVHPVSTSVGELACQKFPTLKELTVSVVACEEHNISDKVGKKKKSSADPSDTMEYDVVFNDSILFPEGGGQPCDHGDLVLLTETGTPVPDTTPIKITTVVRRGDTCVVVCPVPLPVGCSVRQVVDWARREDHTQHHTAQHLLSALVEREAGLPTISWSLTHPTCFIQLELAPLLSVEPRPAFVTKEKKLSDDMVARIQSLCNDAISQSAPVYCHLFESKEAYQAHQPNVGVAHDNGVSTFRSRGIPEDVTGPIRLIEIERYDSCTCCGTHVSNLASLHALHLLHQECKNTTVKLHFVTGNRSIALFDDMYARERALSSEMGGAKPEDLVTCAQRKSKELTDHEKLIKRWTVELAEAAAAKLSASLAGVSQEGAVVIVCRRDDVNADFFTALKSALASHTRELVFVCACALQPSSTHVITPNKDVLGQVFISGTGAASQVSEVVSLAQQTLKDLKGGVSNQGFRGKGSLKEWKGLVDELETRYNVVR